MASYHEELLAAAALLLHRRKGLRGQISAARIRRSASTAYYALFHFILDEAAKAIVGTHGDLRRRRRVLSRVFTHAGIKKALERVGGARVHDSAVELLRPRGSTGGIVASPPFAMQAAAAFADVQAQRHDADYNLNEAFDEADVRVLIDRVRSAISSWESADTAADRDFKHALSLLMLLKGELRREA